MSKSPKQYHAKIRLLIGLVFFFSAFVSSYSQTAKKDSIRQSKYVFVDVQKTYERIVDKGYESQEIYEYLGNYYFEKNNLPKSKLYFDKLFTKYNWDKISSKSKERYQMISK